ncbi:uncharacterized protein A4U43_C03F25210 [Asparagus officinalis]|uniref:Uncharacterized protein n=1 Tax=Asparagus officinalis TaxID=4686 RepID=A0A5P1FCT9_ASPOF|nr:uncharacterized protein A4U43_C03F25210 [Asparagus officinalis]
MCASDYVSQYHKRSQNDVIVVRKYELLKIVVNDGIKGPTFNEGDSAPGGGSSLGYLFGDGDCDAAVWIA